MEIRTLGRTDLKVTRISMGTMTFGSQVSETDGIRMVDRCLEAGINFFDTANVYNNGLSESILGKALKGRRHDVVLATKVRGKMGDEPDDAGLSRPAIRKAIDASLKRLQTDQVDLIHVHSLTGPDDLEKVEAKDGVLNVLYKLRDQKVTLMQVVKTAGNSLWASPLSFLEASTPGTGGWIDTPSHPRETLPLASNSV